MSPAIRTPAARRFGGLALAASLLAIPAVSACGGDAAVVVTPADSVQ